MKKRKNGKSLLQQLCFKYKLAILNENTLEEIWRIRLSKLSVILLGFSIAVLYFFIIAFLIIKTPIRGFLPGYMENINLRKQLTQNALVVDSIQERVRLQTNYIEAMRTVVAGEIHVDSTMTMDSIKAISAENISDATQSEKEFRDLYEKEESVTVNLSRTNEPEEKNYLMQSPAKGRVLESFNLRSQSYGVTLSVDKNTSVSSVLDGVVVYSDYSLGNMYVLSVQHPDNMISVYRIRQPFMKKMGDKVRAGEILSTFRGNEDDATYFEFQLWKDGVALDPQTFITF